MKRLFGFLLIVLSLPAWSSTGFRIEFGSDAVLKNVYAISTGWYHKVQAAIMVNPKNMRKTAELFGASGVPFQWTSAFGSVSQTMRGLEFPMSGVNEKGLVIQAAILQEREYPAVPKNGHGLDPNQWIQYHLDTSSSVLEVIQKSVTLNSPILPQEKKGNLLRHFQVCDLHDCAVFSFYSHSAFAQGTVGRFEVNFLTGKTSIDTVHKWPLSALSNDSYDQSIARYNECTRFPCETGDDSMNRFIMAAQLMKKYSKIGPIDPDKLISKIFESLVILDQSFPLTTWNETFALYSASEGNFKLNLSYKSPTRPVAARQWIDFENPDFDCRHPVKMWWLDMSHSGGDKTKMSIPFSQEAQENLGQQLKGSVSNEYIAGYIAYPSTKTKCLTP